MPIPDDGLIAVPHGHVLVRGWLHGNCVLLSDALIDTGYVTGVDDLITAWQRVAPTSSPQQVLLTHGHCDHTGGAAALAKRGADIVAHPTVAALTDPWDGEALWAGERTGQILPPFRVDRPCAPGEAVHAGGVDWEVLDMPGHARGGVAFFEATEGVLVTGDALWEDGFGGLMPWLDGPGVFEETERTLATLAQVPASLVVPGHGLPFTDMAAALGRARGRLDYLRANPDRHRFHAARVLLAFRDLATPGWPADERTAWVRSAVEWLTPLPGDDAPMKPEPFAAALLDA